jgi:hypothetical protein
MKRKSLLGAIASFTLLSMTALDVAGDIKPSLAQTEVPLTIRAGGTEGTDGFALLSLTVPNQTLQALPMVVSCASTMSQSLRCLR